MKDQNSGQSDEKFKAYWIESAICALVFLPVVMQLKDTRPWIVPIAMTAGAAIVLSKDFLISTLVSIWDGVKKPHPHPRPSETSSHR